MKYIEFINQLIRDKIYTEKNIVLFGQNIGAGSCLAGLTKNLKVKNGLIINTPNSENSLCGIGFGLMISGLPSIFFMKQQDFLLLAVDHLVNTFNFIRIKIPKASFTIVSIVVDSGYQGIQSSLNNFADFCSMARVCGFTITNKVDSQKIINNHLIAPGFRIVGVSQRLFKQELIDLKAVYSNKIGSIFQYTSGRGATIVCFNFSLPYGFDLWRKLKNKGMEAALFSVNMLTPINWDKIISELRFSQRLVVIDDSKSANLACDNFLVSALSACHIKKKIIIKRKFSSLWYRSCLDRLKINYHQLIKELIK